MNAEEFDFAIYGSGVDAAFLAADLMQRHQAKVVLIRDHVNDYSLPYTRHYSIGPITDLGTLALLRTGEENWLSTYGGRNTKDTFSKVDLHLSVANIENDPLLQFVEGALIDADRNCERRVAHDEKESLLIPGVVAPNRSAYLQSLFERHSEVGIKFVDRRDLKDVKSNRTGQLSFKLDKHRCISKQVVILDDDLIAELHADQDSSSITIVRGTKTEIRAKKTLPSMHRIVVDSGLKIFSPAKGDTLRASISGNIDQLHDHTNMELKNYQDMRLVAQGHYRTVETKDGTPYLAKERQARGWVFAGGGVVSPFLMTSVSDALCATHHGEVPDYWKSHSGTVRSGFDLSPVMQRA